jgi:hypothetical protein
MAKPQRPTWAQVGIRNAGIRKTGTALSFAVWWGLATAELGREPESVDEFAATMEMSRRTAFRDQGYFRQAFPTESTPGRINKITGAQARYDELYRKLKERGAARRDAQHLSFFLGASLADV